MSESMTYNGWANYETWAVALWLDNEQGSFDYFRERAAEIFRESEPGEYEWQDRRSEAVNTLADMIQAEHEENTPTVSGVFADLLNAALSEVDWREIAQHYVDDIALELEAEEAKEAAESEEATS